MNGMFKEAPSMVSRGVHCSFDSVGHFDYDRGMDTEREKEEKCRRCGRCCCAKLLLDDEVVYTPFLCKYLDEKTRLCTVYENRHEMNPDCLTLEEGIRIGVFPADCPYVADLEEYKPPREDWTQEDLDLYAEACENDDRTEKSGGK